MSTSISLQASRLNLGSLFFSLNKAFTQVAQILPYSCSPQNLFLPVFVFAVTLIYVDANQLAKRLPDLVPARKFLKDQSIYRVYELANLGVMR